MSNYITEAFKQLNLLEDVEEIKEISLDAGASGIDELRSFLDDAAVDPDEEMMDVYDLQAEAEEDLQKSYEGKVILECTVCHSHVFEDPENISITEDGEACMDLECPYCMSNEGYYIIGEVAPYSENGVEEPVEDVELDEIDIEGAADDIDDEDIIEESYRTSRRRRRLKESTESPEKIMQALDRASKNNSNILIAPSPGRGTISTISKWCKNNGRMCRIVDCLTMDPEDIGGAVVRNGDRSDRLQSQLMSEIGKLGENSVLVLDDINRAEPEIQGALLSVVEKAPGIVVGILVGNAPLDSAMKSRFYKVEVNESCNSKKLKEDWDEEFENEYDAIMDDDSLSEIDKDEALKKLYAYYGMNESMKLDGIKELYDNDEIRGVDELEGSDKMEGSDAIRGDKHKAPISESRKPRKRNKSFKESIDSEDIDTVWEILEDAGIEINDVDEDCIDCCSDEDAEAACDILNDSGFSCYIEESEDEYRPNSVIFESLRGLKKSYKAKKLSESRKSRKRNKRSLKEGIEDVSVTTEDETMTMTTKEDGGVVIETSPKSGDEFEAFGDIEVEDTELEPGDEMVAPISDETSEIIDASSDALDTEDEESFDEIKADMESEEGESDIFADDEDDFADLEDFDEESFNGLGESYLRNCYENVRGFKTSKVSSNKNRLFIEGIIKFDSGNEKKTNFVFSPTKIKNNKYKFEGYNKEISRGKKTFKLSGVKKNNKLVCESLNYNYRSRNELNESVRVYGTIKKKK